MSDRAVPAHTPAEGSPREPLSNRALTNCTSARCRAWAEIDLDALTRNFRRIRARLPERVRILVVVKADAYGLGAVPVARRLAAEGAFGFGVGDSQEALELRDSGITKNPILILGAIIEGEMANVVARNISTCVHSSRRVQRLESEAASQRRIARVHLMVDTGMGRLGPQHHKALELAKRIDASPWLQLDGVCTHFSCAYEEDRGFTLEQQRRFHAFSTDLRNLGIHPPLLHGPNSGAIFGSSPGLFNMARPGIAIYGLDPGGFFGHRVHLEPVLNLRTSVVYLKDVPPRTPIGYGRKFVTSRSCRIATLPVGYNDGYSYRLSHRAKVLVRGRFAPVVGSITMDYTMVDVTDIPDVRPGDPVTLIGKDSDKQITVNEIAEQIGTIPYEVTCQLGRRVQRIAVRRREPGPPAGSPKPRKLRRTPRILPVSAEPASPWWQA